jgi:hypothetical protein
MAPVSSSILAQMNPAMLEAIKNGPALALPEGETSHLDSPWDERYWLYIDVSLCMAIMGIFILIRIYTKWKIVKKWEAADCKFTDCNGEDKANRTKTLSLPAM